MALVATQSLFALGAHLPMYDRPSTARVLNDPPEVNPDPNSPEVIVDAQGTVPGPGSTTPVGTQPDVPFDTEYVLACMGNGPEGPQNECLMASSCPDPADRYYVLWVKETEAAAWVPTTSVCLGPEEAPRPRVTPDLVLNAVRRIGLPALRVHVQPEGETLVNLDTIFFAQPEPFARTVQLLGFSVDVEATPTSFAWAFGDGAGMTTETPGAPYPDQVITHAYADADVTEHASVDATYTVRFRVDGGEWQTIDETISADGPTTAVQVKEAVPVLTGD
jgi:hypothetical protein